ncbi:HAD family hydrolase [Streptomyces specialis]|uniref:HAD family hydrolase n=1 Tax=Streptomyces specialis TaxID=498367 RepID=UPI00073ECD61|nr:HAD-IB family hydrolase [Streptomyces specialis]
MTDVETQTTNRTATRAAFFDVDETLLNVKSMFHFLRYWMARHGDDGSGHDAVMAEVRAQAAGGVPRTEINRRYYRRFAGVEHRELADAGREWYEEYRASRTAVVVSAWAAASRHRNAGDTVVLVSGSFRGLLEPMADDLGADVILCSEPIVGPDGRLTGEIQRPMIGENKAAAVRATMARLGLGPDDCTCYGDHSSDLDMLMAVGNPVVVGADPVLIGQAQTLDWPVLPATPGPLRNTGALAAIELTGRAGPRATRAGL